MRPVTVSEPLVSVVLPVFNGLPYVVETVDSILSQDYSNLHLHIVDNGSTDGTSDWLRSVGDARVSTVFRDSTQSPSDNWSQATELATGEFTKLVCADDLLAKDALTRQVSALLQEPSVVMAASQRNVIDSTGQVLKRNYGLGGLRGVVAGVDAIRACMRAGTNLLGEPLSVLFRTQPLMAAMPWGGSSGYLTDLATYARVIHNERLICLPGAVGSFRVSGGSWSTRIQQEHQNDFLHWRDEVISGGWVPWTRRDAWMSSLSLRLRTRVRHWYLQRA